MKQFFAENLELQHSSLDNNLRPFQHMLNFVKCIEFQKRALKKFGDKSRHDHDIVGSPGLIKK